MNGMRLSDAELARLLQAHMPQAADQRLREAIHEEVVETRQLRSVPGPIGAVLDVEPRARRRALLLAATLLVAVSLAVVGAVGAILERLEPAPVVDLSLEPPADLPTFVGETYSLMPELQPMTISTLEDGVTKGRILVDASGAIRIEQFASLDATEPATYIIYAGTSMGELVMLDSEPRWYEQGGAIGEDPRVFVLATLGSARFVTGREYGCEIGVSPGEVYSYTPGERWEYVGVETVAGRPAHHVTCGGTGDLWIDAETRITLRSQGAKRGPGGWPVPGELHTIEVTDLALGQPPPDLFEIRRPDGVAAISEADYQKGQCIRFGWCLAVHRPLVTPPPAPDQEPPTLTPAELIALAEAAPTSNGPYEITVMEMTTGMSDEGSRTVVYFDGVDRYRIERTSQIGTVWEATNVQLVGLEYNYISEILIDGTEIWRSSPRRDAPGPVRAYPVFHSLSCAGLEHRGVDLVAGRAADHLGCVGDDANDAWIDRETHLVVRTQAIWDPSMGAGISEVLDIVLGPDPDVEWELPPGADVRT